MSESLFSKASNQLSATSEIPNWARVTASANRESGASILNDINNMLSEVRHGAEEYSDNEMLEQAGGAKRRSKKNAKKAMKKSRSASRSKKSRSKSKAKETKAMKKSRSASRPKKSRSKTANKNNKQKGGKKMKSRSKSKMAREMPKFMKDMMEVKAVIKKENSDIKDGPGLSKVVSTYLKSAGSVSKAVDMYRSEHKNGQFKKDYDAANKAIAAKREQSKAEKKAAKASRQ